MSVGELAERLGISHPSVSETRNSLEKAGLAGSEPDPDDGRRRSLRLTPDGERLVAKLRPLWRALDEAAIALEAEAGEVVEALDRLEQALARQSIYQRVKDRLD